MTLAFYAQNCYNHKTKFKEEKNVAKRILITMLVLCLAVSMSACGLTETIKNGITEGVESALEQLGDAVQFAPGAKLLQEEVDDIVTDADGMQTLQHSVIRYEYDENGNQTLMETTITDANGNVSTIRNESKFDEKGSTVETKTVEADGSTFVSHYVTDENGRATEIKEEDSNGYTCTRTYTYDENGNEIRSTYTASDGSNTETVNTYNESGYTLHAETTGVNADGSDAAFVSDFEYDAENRMLKSSCKNAEGVEETTEYEYDANGKLVKEIFVSDGKRTERVSTFDENGNEIEYLVTEPDGKTHRTTKQYDANGNCMRSEYNGDYKSVDVYFYNEDGREIYNRYDAWFTEGEVAHTYSVNTTAYNQMGHETSYTTASYDGSCYSTASTYDLFGNILKMTSTYLNPDGSSTYTVRTSTYEAAAPATEG